MAARPVLVTGCSSGIGRATARVLRARGYPVYTTARRPEDVVGLEAEGFPAVRLDLDDTDSVAAAADWVLSATEGQLYGLFNNAAYGQPGAVEDLSREALRAQFETNLFGTHDLTRRVIPGMRRAGAGRIIMNSSVLGFVAMPFRGAYNASKFALEGYCDTLRLELTGSGVAVSLIQPGPIRSRFRENALRAFQRHPPWTDPSVHRDAYARMETRLATPGAAVPFTLPPEAVAARVRRALETPTPRARYPVTVPTYLFAVLKRVLPTALLDRMLARAGAG